MRRLKSCATWVIVAAILAASPLRAADVAEDDPLVRSVHQAIAGALNTALEHARSNHPVSWGDPTANLTGSIVVYAPALQGGKWCRSFKYVVHSSQDELTDSGLHCRDSIGLWRMAGVPDLLDKRAIATASAAPSQPAASLLRLQKNLVRLAYGGPTDGSTDAAFTAALGQFEEDAGMRPGTDPDAIRRALALSTVMLARSDTSGVCRAPDHEDGATIVCGRRG